MKYKLGEFVRFVEERREGYITRIIDESTIAVTDEDGFEIPVLSSQVTRVHGQGANEDQSPDSVHSMETEFVSNGTFIGFTTDKKVSSVVHVHLVNSTSYQLMAVLITEKNDKFNGQFQGIIKPKSSLQIHSVSLNELDQWPKFHLQAIRFATVVTGLKPPIEFSEKFRAKDFSGSKKSSEYLEQPAWLIQIDSEAPIIDPQKLKESFFKTTTEKIQPENPGKEVDLHIERLRDNFQLLSNTEILDAQLAHFRKNLDAAIVHKLTSIIFIHGIGNGVLRNEIYKVISKHPQVKTFMDAHKERFGYGATEVFLR